MTNSEATLDNPAPTVTELALEIKRHRKTAGWSQPQLAGRIGYTPQYVSRAERGRGLPSQDLVRALDSALTADGQLCALWRKAKAEQATQHAGQIPSSAVDQALTGITTGSNPGEYRNVEIQTPTGRFFSGSTTPVLAVTAHLDRGRIVATPTKGIVDTTALRRPHRQLLVATVLDEDGRRFYGLDRRRAHARLTAANVDAPLLIPHAYALDEFTLALLWAVTNLDDALLDDDAELTAASHRVTSLDLQPRSTAGLELAGELSEVSQMWLGSDFCARHILRHADELADVPAFWTREQRGEEASTWLLFAHKYQYLQRTASLFNSASASVTRSFCIPPETVSTSWRPERVLMLLTAALMESFDIHITVCVESEYTATQGFLLDSGHRAIIATWINTDSLWLVDITDHRPTLIEFADATDWARTHTILSGHHPNERLRQLADYLELDWPWLVRRCSELADHGIAGFTRPRSRLLSVAGLDRACRFVADLGHGDR